MGHSCVDPVLAPDAPLGGDDWQNYFRVADYPYSDNHEGFIYDQVLCVFLTCELVWLQAGDRKECQQWGVEAHEKTGSNETGLAA